MGRPGREQRLWMRRCEAFAAYSRALDCESPSEVREARQRLEEAERALSDFRWPRTLRRAEQGNEKAIRAMLRGKPADVIYLKGIAVHAAYLPWESGKDGWSWYKHQLAERFKRGSQTLYNGRRVKEGESQQ
jgi:hypothetical protein